MPHLVRLVFSHLVSVLINPSVLTLPLPSSPLIVHLSFRLSILSYNPSQSASPLYSHMSSLHGFRCTSSRHSVHHGICRMSSITAPVVYYSIVIKGLWSFTHSSKVRQVLEEWVDLWQSSPTLPDPFVVRLPHCQRSRKWCRWPISRGSPTLSEMAEGEDGFTLMVRAHLTKRFTHSSGDGRRGGLCFILTIRK